jgi:hypothetical protein
MCARSIVTILGTCVLATLIAACGSTTPAASPTTAPTAAAALASDAAPTIVKPTVISCGTFVLENPAANGTYMLVSPLGVRIVVFRTLSSRGLPEFGTYACARFNAGSARPVSGLSLTEFVSFVERGEAEYIPAP